MSASQSISTLIFLKRNKEMRMDRYLLSTLVRRVMLVTLLAIALFAFLWSPAKSRQAAFADESSATAKAAVRKVLDDQVEAWNKGDLEGFMAGYWKSENLSFSSGKDK